uniref:Uncharacterized protein n=1 Tax=Romanomermis culicivorax TaxID=13658 RepID=A0A915HWN1_ROMCU
MIAMDRQEAGPGNLNQDADGPPPQNIKGSPPRVELAGQKRDIFTLEIRPNLDEDQEGFCQLERAPKLSNQELALQLRELKGTIEAVFNIIVNATTEDNKWEANSPQQELDRQ